MTEKSRTPKLRRVVVALDAGEEGRAVLEAAASLAAELEAELVGLFVEDTELIEAAALPVARTIPSHARVAAPLDAALMRRALKISADKAGHAVAAAAARRQVRWSFRVARGMMAEQVLSEVRRHDLLALGAAGRPMRRPRITAATRVVAEQAPCSVLLTRAGGRIDRPVIVLYDGAERALALGHQIARSDDHRWIVLAVGESAATVSALERSAAAWLAQHGRLAELRGLVAGAASDICDALRNEYVGTLVFDRQGSLARKLALETVLDQLACSLFMLR